MRDRVRFHLDPSRCTAQVVMAVASDRGGEQIVGHTILRVEAGDAGRRFGLVSTTYVDPSGRRAGMADRLLAYAEDRFRAQSLPEAATWTSATNAPLIALYAKHGFAQTERGRNPQTGTWMVRLAKSRADMATPVAATPATAAVDAVLACADDRVVRAPAAPPP